MLFLLPARVRKIFYAHIYYKLKRKIVDMVPSTAQHTNSCKRGLPCFLRAYVSSVTEGIQAGDGRPEIRSRKKGAEERAAASAGQDQESAERRREVAAFWGLSGAAPEQKVRSTRPSKNE
jgi:hypothetical protein